MYISQGKKITGKSHAFVRSTKFRWMGTGWAKVKTGIRLDKHAQGYT
jgi:hypothetical protein